MGRAGVLLVVAVLVVVIALPLSVILFRHQQPQAQRAAAPTPAPASGSPAASAILWGMWIKDAEGQADKQAVIAARESTLGHHLDVFHWFESWDTSWGSVSPLVDSLDSSGRTPMITWEADKPTLSQIAQGRYDAYIDSWARGAASRKPHEIWIRIFHEFNDPSSGGGYPWSIEDNPPATLIAAWRHVHDRFAAAGADNVRWIWNPDGVNLDSIAAGYPGDSYVDYTGWDSYGYDDAAAYQAVSRVTHKPMVIGEFGPSDSGQTSELQDFTTQVAGGSYPLIHALVYFDEGTYSIARNPSARDALRRMLASPSFSKPAQP
jgi:mannan endo-1,4-beta-mannosidase